MTHRTYMAIDLGDKRTGLAIGDSETGIASPLKVLFEPDRARLAAAIVREVAEHLPHELILGIPLNMDGSEGSAALSAREFGDLLARRVQLPIHYQDERLTSFAAEERLARTGRTHKEKARLRDALAAVEILRDFLSAR